MKKPVLIIIILLIAGLLFWVFRSEPNTPSTEKINTEINQSSVDDTEITTINKDIESIDIGNADLDFNDINKDLQGL